MIPPVLPEAAAVDRAAAGRYEIRVWGRLSGETWAQWFEGMTVTVQESGETVISGAVADQAALYGLLSRLRDLALPLVSVNRVEHDTVEEVHE